MTFKRHHWLVVSICLFLFSFITLGIAGVWSVGSTDRMLTDAVPALRGPFLNEIMLIITALGNSHFLIFVAVLTIGALIAARAWKEATVFGLAFGVMPILVKLLKSAIARPRPTIDLYGGVESFSFPSGHATNAALIYGALALLSLESFRGPRGRYLAAAFALLAIMIALSRIYLGAHWPSDVLAGVALAGLMLTGMAALTENDRLPGATRYIPVALVMLTAVFPLYLYIALPDARDIYTALHMPEGSP